MLPSARLSGLVKEVFSAVAEESPCFVKAGVMEGRVEGGCIPRVEEVLIRGRGFRVEGAGPVSAGVSGRPEQCEVDGHWTDESLESADGVRTLGRILRVPAIPVVPLRETTVVVITVAGASPRFREKP